jgi:hypothetical protein
MGIVGEFPSIATTQRRTTRAHVNPLDKCTIVSIFPKEINETKPTIQPGFFHIDAGSYNNPTLLTVGPSSWWREIDESQPLLEIPQSSVIVANSIVRDYCIGIPMVDMETAMPGLFWMEGAINLEQIKTEHKDKLDRALAKQKNWFVGLVRLADALWSRSGGSPLAINDDMRLAAKELNFSDKDWLRDTTALELIRCIACGSMRNPLYPVCPNCKSIIDPDMAKKLALKFADSK